MTAYERLKERLYEAQTLISIAELLGWDQETMMPRKAASFRAEEQAVLSTLVHERATAPDIDLDFPDDQLGRRNLGDAQPPAKLERVVHQPDPIAAPDTPVELDCLPNRTS